MKKDKDKLKQSAQEEAGQNEAAEKEIKGKEGERENASEKKYKYLVTTREAKKHERKRRIVLILLIFLLITLLLGGSVYGMLAFLQYNNFRVLVDKEGANILSLSYTSDFVNPTEVLALGGPKYMDNITLMDVYYKIPEFEAANGTYTGGDSPETLKYLAATFYLKNITDYTQVYTEAITLSDVTKDVDAAIRIMLIKDGEKTVYAKERGDGTPEEVVPGQYFTKDGIVDGRGEPWMTTPFASPRHAFYNAGNQLRPQEIVKYTIFVWLEGWDQDCVDARLGGTIKLEFHFTQQNTPE